AVDTCASTTDVMRSPRSQNDRMLFSNYWREMLEQTPNLDFYQDMVQSLIVENNAVKGVITGLGHHIKARSVIITSGTFLNGVIHIGEKKMGGGRVAEKAATGITEQLASYGFESARLKTGTPPRIDGRSLDYSMMEEQKGDDEITGFSYLNTQKPDQQRSCWVTYTNKLVHEALQEGFDRSPMFQGRIEGRGPRYCPSIEDKINRFADRDRHQLFVEPEGWNTIEIYLNGFSTSLPEDVQSKALRLIPGFKNAKMFRPGYAIEYDYFPPTQLHYSLETKGLQNLFFAGQINGTTGYEEAACQGLMAGINAHQKTHGKEPVILKRSDAYIGVLIDDLISKGTDEPYRMFTSRAEFRTLLRQDNADLRLTSLGYNIGLASTERYEKMVEKKLNIEKVKSVLSSYTIDKEESIEYLQSKSSSVLMQKQKALTLLLRPNIDLIGLIENIQGLKTALDSFDKLELEQAEIQTKYGVYIEKEIELMQRMNQLENLGIPDNFNYDKIFAISSEALQKFKKIRPQTIGQASRISGVNPSDVQILMVYMGR
ncbi:MAG: tRNA uridine-5-carboxymethylaminomethyl(34) synthesis enzyme MnmG, partial [Chitinophagaceae bacterium]